MSLTISVYRITSEGYFSLPMLGESLDVLTLQFPPGLYTTFRTFDGGRRVLGLRQHLERLYRPLALLGIRPRVEAETVRAVLRQIAAEIAPRETRFRLLMLTEGEPGQVFALAEPFSPLPPEIYQQGVAVITFALERPQPGLKATTFIQASEAARRRMREQGAYEAIRVRLRPDCRRGKALEGLTSNFYVVRGETLITAAAGVLPGVTRRTLLRLARQRGLAVVYRAPCLSEPFDEAFLTSSSRGVVPIVRIDGEIVGQGRPGAITQALHQAYDEYVKRYAEVL